MYIHILNVCMYITRTSPNNEPFQHCGKFGKTRRNDRTDPKLGLYGKHVYAPLFSQLSPAATVGFFSFLFWNKKLIITFDVPVI